MTNSTGTPQRRGLEIHIWMGIQPPIYQLAGVLAIASPPAQFPAAFRAANDEDLRR